MCVPRRERFRAAVKLSYFPDTDSPWWVLSKSQQNSNTIFVNKNDRSEQRFLLYIRQMCYEKILKSVGLFWIRQYLHPFSWSVLCVYICVCVLCLYALRLCGCVRIAMSICVCVDQLICLLVWKDTIYFLLYFSSPVNLFGWFSSVYESTLLLYVFRSFLITLPLSISLFLCHYFRSDWCGRQQTDYIHKRYVRTANPTYILSSWLFTTGNI